MNTEQLKMILDLLRDAGVGAWWIALLYIMKSYFFTLVWSGTIVIIITKVATLTYKAASLRGELERVTGANLEHGSARTILVGVVAAHVNEINRSPKHSI
jgi:hypothetical protein